MSQEIEFNADRMIRGLGDLLEDVKKGKVQGKYRTRMVEAKPVGRIDAQRILELREEVYHMSRAAFASVLNVPSDTLRKWETGQRNPSGAARRLLDIMFRKPDVAQEFVCIAMGSGRRDEYNELESWLKRAARTSLKPKPS